MTKETAAAIVEVTDVIALLGVPYPDLIDLMNANGYAATAGMIENATTIYHGDHE